MLNLKNVLMVFIAFIILTLSSVFAATTDPLFINQTSSDTHRSAMAIGFGANQLKLGHPLTIFFNDHGVYVVTKNNAQKYKEQQKMIQDLVSAGAIIYVCPSCMKKFNIKETDLVPGAKVSNPQLTGDALFKAGTRTLSW